MGRKKGKKSSPRSPLHVLKKGEKLPPDTLITGEMKESPARLQKHYDDLRERAARLPAELNAAHLELTSLLRRLPTVPTLSLMAFQVFVFNPETLKERDTKLSILVEYPTWLYLSEVGLVEGKFDWDLFERAVGLVQQLVSGTFDRLNSVAYPNPRAEPLPEDTLLARARTHALSIRNVPFRHQALEQAELLFAPFADELHSLVGFNIRDAISICHWIARGMNARLETERLAALARSPEPTVPWVFSAAVGTNTLRLMGTDIEKIPTSNEVAKAVLEFFSLGFGRQPFGDQLPTVVEELHLAPLVKLDDDLWLCHLADRLFYALRPSLERAIQKDTRLWKRYQHHRAKWLECRALEHLQKIAKRGQSFRRLFYSFDDGHGIRRYELDGLMAVDSALFLVEMKAGNFPLAARRGARKSAKEHVHELVGDALEQAARTLRFLRSQPECLFFDEGNKPLLTIQLSDYRRIHVVNVTLDDLTAYVTKIAKLAKFGIASVDVPVWSVSEADLATVADLFPGAGVLTHYLSRRAFLESRKIDAVDELDWVAAYLKYRLLIQDFESLGVHRLQLLTHTDSIANYYLAKDGVRRTAAAKPELEIPANIAAILANIEERGRPGFIEAGCTLLDQWHTDLAQIAEDIQATNREAVLRGMSARLYIEKDHVLVYFAALSHVENVSALVAAAKQISRRERAVGIGVCLGAPADAVVSFVAGPQNESPEAQALAWRIVRACMG